ncbi:SDR family NAD(P)-dependent oxidoreductase [Dinghuibacter silviterrae]|uniref:Glucose 1-dehydrogenase/3-dehydrosphinganine reductase n=1 Tax=Dinghuibacter silviterrae TaxID=1539049 RepID=A0A4R8DG14_9BACT|nr:glucose 1-dehydrogenase [Dinghuibacter silviterrae]TDW95900.1 glucose 1-dehydrogenase/3-dehydrosphinganine reductase [Dinghuibacter silviterrae]
MNNGIDLRHKNVLITGGGQGIGAAIGRAMAACGAHLLLNYLNAPEKAGDLASELTQRAGIKALTYQADISRPEEVAAMFDFFDRQLGPIDVLVNNAGCETIAHAIDLSLEDWDRVFNVNLRGAFICAQAAAKRMQQRRQGVILNISSIHDKVPRKGLIHYCSAKAALNMMTKCLALELAEDQIRVIAVSPGAIETEMNKEEIAAFGKAKFNGWIPLGRLGTVEDVAWTCAFLASDMAAYLTATEIYIDGGYMQNTIPYDPRTKKS